MTVQKLITTGFSIAGLTFFGGAIAKQPVLINAAINLGFTSSVGQLVVKQNQQALKQQLALSTHSKPQLAAIEATLQKHQKQLKQQRTRQNCTLSKVSKLNHQQKITAIAISQQVDKLIDLAQNNFVTQPTPDNKTVKPPLSIAPSNQPITRVYIDGNNFRFALKDMNIDVDYKALRLLLMPKTGKAIFHFYTGVFSTPTYTQERLISCLHKYGYQVSQLPIVQHTDGTFKTVGDDVKISTDMTEESKKGDRVILISGDGDFIPAIKKLQNKGVKVTVAGHKDSINHELRRLADSFLDLDSIKYQIAKHTKLTIA